MKEVKANREIFFHELHNECIYICELVNLLESFQQEAKHPEFRRIVSMHNMFWSTILRSVKDSIADRVYILTGNEFVGRAQHRQICFERLYSDLTPHEARKFPKRKYEIILKKYAVTRKKLFTQRLNFSAHNKDAKPATFQLEVRKVKALVQSLLELSEEASKLFLSTSYTGTEKDGVAGDMQRISRLLKQGEQARIRKIKDRFKQISR